MADPRKPVVTPALQYHAAILDKVHARLLAVTAAGAKDIGANGASFVVIGIAVWARELAELDGRAMAKYFRALADLYDSRTNDNQKLRAEKDRAQAVRALFAALDLEMAEAEGNG
jgi:hypothetical protein